MAIDQINSDAVSGATSNTDGASTQVIAAGGADVFTYLSSFCIGNDSAADVSVELKSGTTVMWNVVAPAGGTVCHRFDPPLAPNASNEAWNFDAGAATTTLFYSAQGIRRFRRA